MVRDDEDRRVERGLVAPPAVGVRVVRPRAGAAAEHAATHDDRAARGDALRDDSRGGVRLAAGQPVGLAPRGQREGPLVELLAALAQRVLEGRIGPGDEAVDRYGEVEEELGHALTTHEGRRIHRPRSITAGRPTFPASSIARTA